MGNIQRARGKKKRRDGDVPVAAADFSGSLDSSL